MKQALNGVITHMIDRGMRRERVSTNFGWAVPSFRVNAAETEIFTCPNDPEPRPIPALQVAVLPDRGITSGDGIYNRVKYQGGNVWQLDIQDSIDGTHFGFDAYDSGDIDLLLQYEVPKGEKHGLVTVANKESALGFRVMDYKGRTIWENVTGPISQPVGMPILWLSYGVNAMAGMKTVKGNPALILEAGKPGIFPLRLGAYPADDPLGKALRFRHGSKTSDPALRPADYTGSNHVTGEFRAMDYEPRSRMNVGFYDSHVERVHYERMINEEMLERMRETGKNLFWIGRGRASDWTFD